MTHLTKGNFDATLANHKLVLVDFWAEWCGPCRMLAPVLDAVEKEVGAGALICKVDVQAEQELANRFDVTGIPCVILFKDGKMVQSEMGFKPKEVYVQLIKTHS
jgi:thioredoxin 1